MKSLFSGKLMGLSLVLFFFNSLSFAFAQELPVNPDLLKGSWNAQWITCPDVPFRAYGVYHFRKTMDLRDKPARFIIHVSADNRYVLYVNGVEIGRGPARSSLYNWNFGSFDIASHLQAGKNVIAALVWNMGEWAPVAQISNQTGFLLQGDSGAENLANSDNSWKVLHDTAYTPCAGNMGAELHTYMVVGPGDQVRGKAYPWGWEQKDYNDGNWQMAKPLFTPVVTSGYGTDNQWTLAPRSIPQMEEKMQRLAVVRRISGLAIDPAFISGTRPLNIPAHTKLSILLDQSYETVAYPVIRLSQGKNAVVRLTYAEALFDQKGQKGNRNEIQDKTIKGLYDIFYPDGQADRSFSPLWVRTYRYLQIDVQTEDEPLEIADVYGIYTGYPFVQKASFSSDDGSLEAIWKTGWRTARLCAGETYFDCPYYEQLQYEGDTRIQSLISLYNTGDSRLMQKAIDDFFNSRVPEGLTQGRYPSNRLQVIPPFSLFWVSMMYDYWMHCQDDRFLEKYLDGADIVLKWFERRVDKKLGMLGPMKWWNFSDWNKAFPNGVPDGAVDGHSAVVSLQFAYTLRQASAVFKYYGRNEAAAHYSALADLLAKNTYQHCFDLQKMEMANTPEKVSFSQHAGIMGILADAIPENLQKQVLNHILYDSTLSQATFYYRFYLTRAMTRAGMGNLYYSQLTPWRNMLKMGLTTFAEEPDPTRSDCHAWSASPNYDFLATLCGIMPDAPGFKKVLVSPQLGELKEIKGLMPIPAGSVEVSLKRKGTNGIEGVVTLPQNITGRFVWNGREIKLMGGHQRISL
ncbi:MAG TPA: alpha-L-rhamnosidase C-terminal domain-containing protein [Puia sp.]